MSVIFPVIVCANILKGNKKAQKNNNFLNSSFCFIMFELISLISSVPRENIVGKAWLRYWPPKNAGFVVGAKE